MKTPESLETLVDYGIIQEVVRPLMSGKEAQIYVVVSAGEECVAKVYKEASQRSFKHRAEYTEGRRTRNSRDQRAVTKRTRHGRKQDEAAWRTAEVDMIYRLRDAGVRVPEPINYVEGVLLMELVKDAHGKPAPRLGDLSFTPNEAHEIYSKLIREVVRMLCAGAVHGDLSEFNVLMAADGPVVIDFPQSVDPTKNQNARKLLLRDVENLHRFLEQYAPEKRRWPYAQEMWSLYESNRLRPDTELRGDYRAPEGVVDTQEVLALIDDAQFEEQARRTARGVEAPTPVRPMRTVVDFTKDARRGSSPHKRIASERGTRPERASSRASAEPVAPRAASSTSSSTSASSPASPSSAEGSAPPRKRRRRTRRRAPHPEASGTAGNEIAARTARSVESPADKKPGGSREGEETRPARRRGRRRSRSRPSREAT